jgi:hypothetical protein
MAKSQSLPDTYPALLQELKRRIANRSCERLFRLIANWCFCTGELDETS